MEMYSGTNTTSAWAKMDLADSQKRTYYTSSLLLLMVTIVAFRIVTRPKTNAPIVDPPKFFDITTARQRLEAVNGARSLLQRAYKAFPGKTFRIMAEYAELIVLPAKLANEVRNDDRFGFTEFTRQIVCLGFFFFFFFSIICSLAGTATNTIGTDRERIRHFHPIYLGWTHSSRMIDL